ncbi:helix-turn-helix domain-containing protein [Amycolatopsis sp. La24]|uniref:PucR family transcriptional regulator n=1 Tax=Amycolatopsis sp. La24 TaxID=3028304 RepID=UPI0023B0FDBD|nr:helix-turn-helix domain-containing protein [Amycolatopsis sp. La24]
MADRAFERQVDDLAETLRRAVVVDDAELNIVYASRHYGDEDEQRIRAVLQHDIGLEATRHILAQGVTRWNRPGRIPPHPELGMAARLCAPIRLRGLLLGVVLVIDADGSLSPDEVGTIARAAEDLAPHLYTARSAVDRLRDEREHAVAGVLSTDADIRGKGLAYLERTGWLAGTSGDHWQVLHLTVAQHSDAISVKTALAVAIAEVTRSPEATGTTTDSTSMTMLQHRPVRTTPDEMRATAQKLTRAVDTLLSAPGASAAGISDPVAYLAQAWRAREEAVLAARAAARGDDGVAAWSELGPDALLLQFPTGSPERPVGLVLPAALRRLLDVDRSGQLTATLAAFLDHAGSRPRAAAALHIHRTTLYYRLDKITEITGLDLDDGENRLLLHLGLRLVALSAR